MIGRSWRAVYPYALSLGLIVLGWWISVQNTGLDRFQSSSIFTGWTLAGLVIILVGAFLPGTIRWFRRTFQKREPAPQAQGPDGAAE